MGKTTGMKFDKLYLHTKTMLAFNLHSFVGALKNGFDLLIYQVYVSPETGLYLLEALQTCFLGKTDLRKWEKDTKSLVRRAKLRSGKVGKNR